MGQSCFRKPKYFIALDRGFCGAVFCVCPNVEINEASRAGISGVSMHGAEAGWGEVHLTSVSMHTTMMYIVQISDLREDHTAY